MIQTMVDIKHPNFKVDLIEDADKLKQTLFPLSTKYDEKWIKKNSLGENVLYNLESLCDTIEFKEGMKVLDLGCGKAISAIFLAKEFNVNVWAVDPKINPDENYSRIKEMGCEKNVFPMKLDAHNLPFPAEFFDVIIAVDSYMYFGTDEKFTPYITNFLKSDGVIGIIDVCLSKEINYLLEVPAHMKESYHDYWYYVHSIDWWVRLWDKTGLLKIQSAEIVPENDFIKKACVEDFVKNKTKDAIAEALSKKNDNFINIFRLTARRSAKQITGN